ncbi:DUF6020 family protein [Limosilactobacillus ingluviei]
METILKNKRTWLIGLFILSSGLLVDYPTPINLHARILSTNALVTLLALLWSSSLVFFYQKKHYYPQIGDYILGAIFSSLYVGTNLLSSGMDGSNASGAWFLGIQYVRGATNLLLTAWSWLAWFAFLTLSVAVLRYYFGAFRLTSSTPKWIKLFVIIIGCYLIAWIIDFPGQISWDAMRQFCEYEQTKLVDLNFEYFPTNHQPWFVTLIFGGVFSIGNLVNANVGVASVVGVQLIISAAIYARAAQIVWGKLGKFAGGLTVFLFASPVFSSYAITIEKSTLSYALGVAFFILYLQVIDSAKSNALSWKQTLCLILTGFLFAQFRNDSKYVVLFMIVLLAIYLTYQRCQMKKIWTALAVMLLLFKGWGIYLNSHKVVSGAISEALTIPTRQLSYVYLHDADNIPVEDKLIINNVTPVKKIAKNYNLSQGDNLKNLYPVNTFLNYDWLIRDVVRGEKTTRLTKKERKEIVQYLGVWLKEGLKHPADYIAVYLGANTRYLNPFFGLASSDSSLFLNYHPVYPKIIQPTWLKQVRTLMPESVRSVYKGVVEVIIAIPLLALFINPGMPLWVSLTLLAISLQKKQFKLLLVILPLMAMALLFTVTPVNGYSRYTLGATAVMPLIIAYCWDKLSKGKKSEVFKSHN